MLRRMEAKPCFAQKSLLHKKSIFKVFYYIKYMTVETATVLTIPSFSYEEFDVPEWENVSL